jgi:hypothetical protein
VSKGREFYRAPATAPRLPAEVSRVNGFAARSDKIELYNTFLLKEG